MSLTISMTVRSLHCASDATLSTDIPTPSLQPPETIACHVVDVVIILRIESCHWMAPWAVGSSRPRPDSHAHVLRHQAWHPPSSTSELSSGPREIAKTLRGIHCPACPHVCVSTALLRLREVSE